MNTLHLLPFCDLDDREFIFVNNISSIKFHEVMEVMESDFYNLLPRHYLSVAVTNSKA